MSLLVEQRTRLQDIIAAMDLDTPEDVAHRDRLDEEDRQLCTLAQGAREREASMSRNSLMEDVSMDMTGRSNEERRQRNRSKRDF